MKNFVWIGCLALIILLTACSKSITLQELPQPVQSEFIKRYSGARDVDWKKKKETYQAKFKMNDTKITVRFDEQGKVVSVDQK